ncbi:MAG: ABC transporter substrate-binding protein, partial [Burkholderiaceae bacterium]
NFGRDAVLSVKQAKQFGILDKMALVVPYMAPFLGEEVGPDIIEGVYGATGFWWTLEDKYPIAKDFVAAFEKKFGGKPHDSAYIAYLNTALWADAIERAGTFYPPDVIKSYEKGVKRQGPTGEVWFRAEDHQGVINFPIVRGKKKSEMKDKNDIFEIVAMVNGADANPPVGHYGCKLGSYV